MRILIATRSLPFHHLGGMEAVAWDLARALTAIGCNVRVMTTSCPTLPETSIVDGVTIDCLPVPSGCYSAQWWRLSRRWFVERYLEQTDIVLSISAAARSMSLERGSAPQLFFSQAHGTLWGEIVSKYRERTLKGWLKAGYLLLRLPSERGYRRFNGLIAVGEQVALDLRKQPTKWILQDRPIHLISNGIDTNLFRFDAAQRADVRTRLGLSDTDKAIISICRLHPQKGVAEALDGFAAAVAQGGQDLHLIIVGSGPAESALREKAAALGLSARTHFSGAIARPDAFAWLSAADIFLFSTLRQEGLPLNVLEALACGLPCIVSNHINHPDFGAAGVDPRDSIDVARAIATVISVPSNGRASRLPEKYSLNTAARAYLDIFSKQLRGTEMAPRN